MAGQLFLIGTPIGNLSDISPRALETLKNLDVLYCEDTRRTAKLLSHFNISVRTRALSDDAPDDRWLEAVEQVRDGSYAGFVTDAGMPGVSDPGRKLVRAAWDQGLAPVIIPGPSSVGTLLAACPFVSNSFRFAGFPPRKPGERDQFIKGVAESTEPVFMFESPHRAHEFLEELCSKLEPDREMIIGREMTKLHEQFLLFTAGDWESVFFQIPKVGEFTIAVAACSADGPEKPEHDVKAALERLAEAGLSKRDAVRALSAVWEMPANEIKKLAYD